jgi:predicted HTH transcriptional regulator
VAKKNKKWTEEFAQFFEIPSREGLRNILRDHLGESNNYDFKKEWPSYSKVSRHILGLANFGGGCMILGVEEKEDKTFVPVGLDNFIDKTDIHKGIQKFIPTQLKYEVLNFSYENSEYPKIIGRKFQVLIVEDSPEYIPFVAKSNGDGIRKNAIYIRDGASSEEINYEKLQQIINRRLETEHSSQSEFDLDKHIAELKVLYNYIPRHIVFYDPDYHGYIPEMYEPQAPKADNPKYPKEDFHDFIKHLIEDKKNIIKRILIRM